VKSFITQSSLTLSLKKDKNGRIGRLLINYKLLRNNFSPSIIPIEDINKYFGFLLSENIDEFAIYLENLSKAEVQRIKKFNI
jgi:hypothetical protein